MTHEFNTNETDTGWYADDCEAEDRDPVGTVYRPGQMPVYTRKEIAVRLTIVGILLLCIVLIFCGPMIVRVLLHWG